MIFSKFFLIPSVFFVACAGKKISDQEILKWEYTDNKIELTELSDNEYSDNPDMKICHSKYLQITYTYLNLKIQNDPTLHTA